MLAIRAARMSDGLRLHDRPQILMAGDRIADADFTGAQPPPCYQLSGLGDATLTLRPGPDHAAQTAGRPISKWARRTRPPRSARRRLGEPHGPVLRTPAGWVLPDLYDPDGHQMRFYVPGEGAPTADRPARMRDAAPCLDRAARRP
jgi:hypothetical protein